MRNLVERVLDLLPLDPRTRLALDETLADWRHEETQAMTPRGALRADMRGLAAAMSVLAMSTTRQVRDVPSSSAAWLSLLWLVLLLAVVAQFVLAGPGALAAARVPSLSLRLSIVFASSILWLLPLALFLGILSAPERRAPPVLGLAAVAGSGALVVALWIQPGLSQALDALRESSSAALTSSLTLPEALRESWSRAVLASFRLSLACCCPVLIYLAAALRPWRGATRIASAAVVAAIYLGALFTSYGLSVAATAPALVHSAVLLPWLLPGGAVLAAATIAASRPSAENRAGAP